MKRLKMFMALAWLCAIANAQFSVKGIVKDENGNAMAGANVSMDNGLIAEAADLDGNFILNNVSSGKHILEISFTGHGIYKEDLSLNSDIKLVIVLKELPTIFEEVVVSSVRAQKSTPTTYSLMNKVELNKINLGQDAPYLISMEPSVVVSSDAGTGIGYTSMHIRGSDNKKINVTINGVPLNDPESHGVYWVDVPDIAASAQSIQIQRGVGTSTNGPGAFGASINILTDNISSKPFVEYLGAVGSYNTIKNNLSLGSGLIQNHWFIEAKGGLIGSDGYRDRASATLRNYFIQAGYTSDKTIVKLLSFGGFEETYQAWYGINKETLETNRTYNPAGLIGQNALGKDTFYNKMVDHYQQDHLQLHVIHKFTNELKFNAALHYTYGRGYYQDYVPAISWNMALEKFGIPYIVRNNDTVKYSDVIHRLWLKNHFYGAVWGLNYVTNVVDITWGGGANLYAPAKHFGQVIWAKELEIKLDNKNYYENYAQKTDANTFIKCNFKFNDNLNLFCDIQARGIGYKAWGKSKEYENREINIKENYFFINPKLGAYYQLNTQTSIYGSFAIANREPNRSDFLSAPEGIKPKSENLQDIELGFRQANTLFNAEVVFYNMNYFNQLVLTGQLDSEGTPLRKNVKESYRRGVEFILGFKLSDNLKFDQNIALSTNKINAYPSQDSIDAKIKVRTVDIAYSPSVILNQIITLTPLKNISFSLLSKYVSSQFLDNSENADRKIEPYAIFDFLANYDLMIKPAGTLSITLKVNNLLNEKYVSYGIMYYGEALFFPQSTRNYMIGISYKF